LRESRRWLLLLLGLALVRGVFYVSLIPPWQAPDETAHFEYSWLIAQLEELPTRQAISVEYERDLLGSLYEWRFGAFIRRPLPEQMPDRLDDLPTALPVGRRRTVKNLRFSLGYVWAALFILPFRQQDLAFQLYAARLGSVVLQLGIVWLAWRTFRALLPQRPDLIVAAAAFVVFLPQHTFINATVNDGTLAELGACLAFYGWAQTLRSDLRLLDIAAIVGGTLVGAWTKRTAGFLFLFDVAMLALLLARRYRAVPWRRKRRVVALFLLLTVLIVWVALQTAAGEHVLWTLQKWRASPGILYFENDRRTLLQTLKQTLDSFWGQFGWMNLRAPQGWYLSITALNVLTLMGWLLPVPGRRPVPSRAVELLGLALLSAILTWLAFILLYPGGLGYSQGRYLFPIVVPAAFFLVGGWLRSLPERWRPWGAPAVILLMALLDATVVFFTIWPRYYA